MDYGSINRTVTESINKDYCYGIPNNQLKKISDLQFEYRMTGISQVKDAANMALEFDVEIYYPYNSEGNYDSDGRKFIGKMHLILFNVKECMEYDERLEDMFLDGYDRILFNRVFDYERNYYREEWAASLGRLHSENILYLEQLFLMKEFRCCEIGWLIMKELEVRFYGMYGFLITEALPMQHRVDAPTEEMWKLDSMEKDYDKAEVYYFLFLRDCGLSQHQDTRLFFRNGAPLAEMIMCNNTRLR